MTPCALPRWRKTAAPAPSPKSTQVFRSVQSVIDVNFSAPITRTVSWVCDVMNCCAISRPKRKPAQAAEISRQAALVAPIYFGGRNFRLFDRLQRRFRGHVARLFVFRGDATFLDACASGDPFVARIDYARQIFIGENFFGHVTSSADDRDGAPRVSGARARARVSFHCNGESPRRYAGLSAVQSTRLRPGVRS